MTRLRYVLPLWLAPLCGLSAARPVPAATPIQKASNPSAPAAVPALGRPDLAAASELSADDVVRQVLARNPSLAEMVAAWKAAQDRYPQVTSLDDPMFGATGSPPASSRHTDDGGYRFEISQKIPWCGKLALHGENALAEARAAGDDVEDTAPATGETPGPPSTNTGWSAVPWRSTGRAQRLLGEFRRDAEARYTRVWSRSRIFSRPTWKSGNSRSGR